ncbi:MAG TPA: DegV family protein [Jiangellales bacterium]|nr:DegV family protein [Jiangellales bacterium]
MTGPVAVVTDSTAYLDPSVCGERGITVVPLQVVISGRPYAEGVEVGPGDVADALRRWAPVTTSRPNPSALLGAYEAAARAGAAGVVSLHLSADVSGTVEAAQLAARESSVPVEVVDSRSMGMGLGFAVLTASDAARQGAGLQEVAAAARARAERTTALFYVDTLEYLRRGGRIGAAQAFLGTALAVKPLLHLAQGRIEPLEKVRTASRALARLQELALEAAAAAGDEATVDVAVHHLASADRAESLAAALRHQLGGGGDVLVAEVGGVIGAHVGPGMIAVVVSPR